MFEVPVIMTDILSIIISPFTFRRCRLLVDIGMISVYFRNIAFVMQMYTLRAEPPFVFFFTEEEKSRLCPNRVNSLKPPQPELLDYSILFSLVKPVFPVRASV